MTAFLLCSDFSEIHKKGQTANLFPCSFFLSFFSVFPLLSFQALYTVYPKLAVYLLCHLLDINARRSGTSMAYYNLCNKSPRYQENSAIPWWRCLLIAKTGNITLHIYLKRNHVLCFSFLPDSTAILEAKQNWVCLMLWRETEDTQQCRLSLLPPSPKAHLTCSEQWDSRKDRRVIQVWILLNSQCGQILRTDLVKTVPALKIQNGISWEKSTCP